LYALTRWPTNVYIFTHPTIERLVVSPGLTLWGAACPPTTADGWQRQIVRQPDATNLLLAHAPALPHSSASAFHVSESALAATGIDLALLGGSHRPQLPPPGSRILYPGSPHPLAWGEPAARRGAVLVSIAGGHVEFEQICLPSWRLAECAVDLAGCHTAMEAAERVEQALEKFVREPGQTLVADVELEGKAAESFTFKEIRSAITSETEVILRRPFRMIYDLEQLALEPTVRGTLVQRAQEQLAAATDEIARTELLASLQVALMALEGRQVHPDAIG
jgi:DNA repair exonuclease SbcCD nuclease subunit